jgi:2-succinyl-5-enolpyruvyl-6-hydroxy-3-cyclohexene-1-carboxylate synthase
LGEVAEVGDVLELLPKSRKRAHCLDELLESCPDSEPALLREVSLFAMAADSVFLGNSLPVREWSDFAQAAEPVPFVRACRGANGIDGQLSAWLGATVEEGNAWAVLGDITALYDLAAPHLLSQVEQEKRVIVILNNDGGRIFERLPRLAGMAERSREWMTTPHGRHFEHWAAMWGLAYRRISSRDEVDCLESLDAGTTVVEVIPNASETTAFWEAWQR